MGRFTFKTDERAEEFFTHIVDEMMRLFEVSEDEAVARINHDFAGEEIVGYDIMYHETYDFWAKNIMYGHHTAWWLNEAEAQRRPVPDGA